MSKLKNSNCDKNEIGTKLKLWRTNNSITQNVTKPKLWQNSKTQIVTKPKIVTKLKKNQIVTKLELWQILNYDKNKYT